MASAVPSTSDGRNSDRDVNSCKSNTAKFHVGKLKIFCRVCALPRGIPEYDPPISKFKKQDWIQKLWDHDVASDNEMIHPPYICKACCSKIGR